MIKNGCHLTTARCSFFETFYFHLQFYINKILVSSSSNPHQSHLENSDQCHHHSPSVSDSPSVVIVKPLVLTVCDAFWHIRFTSITQWPFCIGLFLLNHFCVGSSTLDSSVSAPYPCTWSASFLFLFLFSFHKLGCNYGPSNQHGFGTSSFIQP